MPGTGNSSYGRWQRCRRWIFPPSFTLSLRVAKRQHVLFSLASRPRTPDIPDRTPRRQSFSFHYFITSPLHSRSPKLGTIVAVSPVSQATTTITGSELAVVGHRSLFNRNLICGMSLHRLWAFNLHGQGCLHSCEDTLSSSRPCHVNCLTR